MEVVSTSNLVSSEAEKTTTTCNFQNMNINSFIMSHDLMRGQIGSYGYIYANIKLLLHLFMMAELLKSALRNTYTKDSKIKKISQQLVEKRNLFYF